MGYDFIGDIHGHAEPLKRLLGRLGYREAAGAWRHPSRTAVFVGDFVDRGPEQVEVLRVVRAMVEAGSAQAVMGNHEFNAIAYATPDPEDDGAYLRPRTEKNGQQHREFLEQVGADSGEHKRWVNWFLELPLWIETADFRVVHACWDPASVEAVRPFVTAEGRIDLKGIGAANRKGTVAYAAVETLLKGKEVRLPEGLSFQDKDGHARQDIRVKWWDGGARTYREAYIGPDGVDMPDVAIAGLAEGAAPDRPTFIGHYWLDVARDGLAPRSERVACVDYSVARGGPLVAYRFDGEAVLEAGRFVGVQGGVRRNLGLQT